MSACARLPFSAVARGLLPSSSDVHHSIRLQPSSPSSLLPLQSPHPPLHRLIYLPTFPPQYPRRKATLTRATHHSTPPLSTQLSLSRTMAPTKDKAGQAEKAEKLTPAQSADLMLHYLRAQNRPYSATDISANLKNRVTKTLAAKVLKEMHEKKLIEGKAAGKQVVYHALQVCVSALRQWRGGPDF